MKLTHSPSDIFMSFFLQFQKIVTFIYFLTTTVRLVHGPWLCMEKMGEMVFFTHPCLLNWITQK